MKNRNKKNIFYSYYFSTRESCPSISVSGRLPFYHLPSKKHPLSTIISIFIYISKHQVVVTFTLLQRQISIPLGNLRAATPSGFSSGFYIILDIIESKTRVIKRFLLFVLSIQVRFHINSCDVLS